jgi:hypothetical protein
MGRNRSGTKRFFLGTLSIGLLGLLYSCGEVGGSGQCFGVGDTGTCIMIESIIPTYEVGGGAGVSNVDAFIDVCEPDNPATPENETVLEEITDHSAEITFRSGPLPGANPTTARDVTLTDYVLVFTLNNCPAGSPCPLLTTQGIPPGETILIPANATVTRTLKFVDLAKKMEYATAIGDDMFGIPANSFSFIHTAESLTFPSYTVNYTFTGTDIFNNDVAVQGFSEFTIGDYNNCPG